MRGREEPAGKLEVWWRAPGEVWQGARRLTWPQQVQAGIVGRRLISAHRLLATGAAPAAKTPGRARRRSPAPLRKIEWVVNTKKPFAGPEQVLRYLSRYTHRVAISNCRLVSIDDNGVAFRWKDYRIDGPERWKTMTLSPHEFIRRFLSHVLPKGFHRIRHYGLFASGNRTANIARARELLGVAPPIVEDEERKPAAPDEPRVLPCPCPRCGGRMIVIEIFARGCEPTYQPTPAPTPIRIDTS